MPPAYLVPTEGRLSPILQYNGAKIPFFVRIVQGGRFQGMVITYCVTCGAQLRSKAPCRDCPVPRNKETQNMPIVKSPLTRQVVLRIAPKPA